MSPQPVYRQLDPALPDINWSGFMPAVLTAESARAIHACDDATALGAMLGALRSYWSAAGGIAIGLFGGLAAYAAGWWIAGAILLALGIPSTLATIEARRRCRQWQGVVEAKLATLNV